MEAKLIEMDVKMSIELIESEYDKYKKYILKNTCIPVSKKNGLEFDMIHFTQLSRKNFKLIPVLDDEYKCVMCDKLEKFYSRKFYITYLENKKKSIINNNENVHPIKKVKWSGAITDYVELVYSLANSRTINQGEISFKDLHESFAYIFEFEREVNIHNTMNEIKKRKNNPTKFLDKLRDHLEDYINK